MKIVHYLFKFQLSDGGVVRAVLDLVWALRGRGHEVTVLSCDLSDVPEAWRAAEGVRWHRIEGWPVRRSTGVTSGGPPLLLSGASRRLAEQCLREADVLHVHGAWDPLNWRLGAMARRLGKPYVVSSHGMLDRWCMTQKAFKKRVFLALEAGRCLRHAAAIHCTAQAEADQVQRWCATTPKRVVPLLADMSHLSNLPGPEIARGMWPTIFDGSPVLLFMGRIHPKKGALPLVEAVELLHKGGRAVKLVLAGGVEDQAYAQRIQELITRAGLTSHVLLPGFVRGQAQLSLYQASDLMVLPTSQENWGLVLTESLACGTPVVTTYGVDIWKDLLESGAAWIVEATGPAMAGVIGPLLEDRPKLAAAGERARRWVFDHWDAGKALSGFEALYASLIRGG
ncbi:MAG: glycosyltransferase [Phycisphaeraceae bacterium]|nr:glycosyltransferase [Phycisphaeraceae bacterium]